MKKWLLIARAPDGSESIKFRACFSRAREAQHAHLDRNPTTDYYIIREDKYHSSNMTPCLNLQGGVRREAATVCSTTGSISASEGYPPRRRAHKQASKPSSKQDEVVRKVVTLAAARFMIPNAWVELEAVP